VIYPKRTITYRFLIEHKQKIRLFLAGLEGEIGYRVTKLELMPKNFGNTSNELESTVRLYTVDPGVHTTGWNGETNFDDSSVVAVATIGMDATADVYPMIMNTTMDAVPFNQDLWVVHWNNHGDANEVNLYIEIEQFPLTSLEASTLCLKNMRNTN
jgi:hypothetical protein